MKTKILLFIFFLIIGFLFTTCTKQSGPTTVSGFVLDAYKNQPIPGATVYVLEAEEGSGFNISTGYGYGFPIKQTTSSSDGSYSIGFDARKGYSYYASASKDECQRVNGGQPGFNLDNDSYVEISKGKKNTNKNIPLIANGYVKLHIKNIDNPLRTDQFVIDNFISSKIFSVNHDHQIILNGDNIDTIIKIAQKGNFDNSINCGTLKNNSVIWNSLIVKLFCPAFDTINYEINY